MGKTCTELFAGIDCTILGNADDEVNGIAYRSDRVQPGDAFFCVVGMTTDGHSFAQDAIDRGAKVLVVERKVYLADATDVTEIVVKDTRKAMAAAAANFYDHPSKDIALVGITGTNGKTTTTYLVEHIARVAGKRTGVIGTVGIRIGAEAEKSAHTTPESPDLQQLFARMREDLKAIDALAAETGVKAVLEIHMDTLISSPSAAYRALEGFDPAHIGLIFDPGNMVNEGFEDYQKSFELLGDYIAHIHIKNGILAPDGEDELGACKWKRVWTPLKKGMADLKKLFAVARKAGYDGTFSIEDFSNDDATPDKLRENIAYLKALAASAQVPAPEQEESAFERLARPERSKP